MEAKNRIDLWKEKRKQMAQPQANDVPKLKEYEVCNYLTSVQCDLIALELAKKFMSDKYPSETYEDYIELFIKAFNVFREDVYETDRKLNKC